MAKLANPGPVTIVTEAEMARLRLAERENERLRAEADGGQVTGNNVRIRQTGDAIRYGEGLRPWMYAYAEWLVLGCVGPPSQAQRLAKARALAHSPVNGGHLRLLSARPDFIAYQRELERGPLEAARAKFVSAFPEYVDAHREALDMARDKLDYSAMARIAEPVLDRVVPKRSEAVAATQVNITLTPAQLGSLDADEAPPLLVSEVVPAAPAPDAP
jgi:hypothetical protein